MATQKNRVEWEFLLNQRQLDRGLKKTRGDFDKTKGKTDTLSRSMGGLTKAAGVLGLAVGAGAILKFGKDAITAASDYDEAINAVKVATGEAADDIITFGKTADDSIGLSETAVLDAAVAFSGFADAIATEDQVAAKFQDYITRAADFGSVLNITTEDSLAKFRSALAGQSEPLLTYGINISAAATKTFALEKGIIGVGETMNDDQKVLARYGLLMQETEKFAGDFANTSGELAGQTKVLTAKIANARVEIGKELQPVYAEFLGITLNLIPAVQGLTGALSGVLEPLGGVVSGLAAITGGDLLNASKLDIYAGALDGLGKGLDFVFFNSGLVEKSMKEVTDRMRDMDDQVEQTKLDDYNELLADGTFELGEYTFGAEDLDFALGGLADTTDDEATPAVEDFKDEVGRLDDAMGDAKTRADIFAGAMFEVAKRAKEAAKEAADAEKLFAGGGGSGQEAEPGSAPPVTNTGPDSGYARGGTLHRGETALVGEEGPEVITAGNALRVHPNGTGGGNVYITVNALDPMQAAEAVKNALDYWNATNA